MKKIASLLSAACFAMFAFGCAPPGATSTTQTPVQLLAALQVQVIKACGVVSPTILSLQAMTSTLTPTQVTDLAKVSKIVTPVCAGANSATLTTLTTADLVNIAFPALISVVDGSSLTTDDKKAIELGLTIAQSAVSAALTQAASAAPISTAPMVIAASAAVAAQ